MGQQAFDQDDWAQGPSTADSRQAASARAVDFGATRNLLSLAWRHGRNHFPCYTGRRRDVQDGDVVYPESFTAMVMADLLMGQRDDAALVRSIGGMLERELGRNEVFYFFKEHDRLPADADCTALGLSVLLRNGARVHDKAHRALDRILANADERGVVCTYFDPTGERDGIVDSVVCANVLFLAFQLGRGDEAQATLGYVREVLTSGAYREGTRYYHSPDTFLYFVGRVLHHFPAEAESLREPLCAAVRERQGSTTHTIDLSQRVLLSAWLGIDDGGELATLIDLQADSGTWPTDSLFRYGRKKIFFGSRAMASTFAMAAVIAGQAAVPAAVEADEADEVLGGNVVRVAFG